MAHKINPGFWKQHEEAQPTVLDDRYQAEIDKALQKAERAYRRAAKRLQKAESTPLSPRNDERDALRREVAARLDELNRLQALMSAPHPSGSRHSGRGSVTRVTNKGRSL